MNRLFTAVAILSAISTSCEAIDYYRSQNYDAAPSNFWIENNSSLTLGAALGCSFCGEIFYNEPPPDDIIFIPSPPMHPSFQSSNAELLSTAKQQNVDGTQCSFCNLFNTEGGGSSLEGINSSMNNKVIVLLVSFSIISAALGLYLLGSKRSLIMASLTRTTLFKSDGHSSIRGNHQLDKDNPLNDSLANSGVRLSDPCYLQTNRDKNLTSPIISDHVSHKKTAIPSKYWAQPGSIVSRTIRRIPNEYEVPSSQTNSTGTSSAVYADMNNEANHRFLSPYNLHTYAEVREVPDPNEHFHTSSNSSAMLSESNYDNAIYSHGNCALGNGTILAGAPNGSVQMSDFNSMRPIPSMGYGPPTSMNHQSLNHQSTKVMHGNSQPSYEQPPQRAQVIITSNNQGINPTLLNYRDRIHNVI